MTVTHAERVSRLKSTTAWRLVGPGLLLIPDKLIAVAAIGTDIICFTWLVACSKGLLGTQAHLQISQLEAILQGLGAGVRGDCCDTAQVKGSVQLQGQALLKDALHVRLRKGNGQLAGLLPVLCIWHHHLQHQLTIRVMVLGGGNDSDDGDDDDGVDGGGEDDDDDDDDDEDDDDGDDAMDGVEDEDDGDDDMVMMMIWW